MGSLYVLNTKITKSKENPFAMLIVEIFDTFY